MKQSFRVSLGAVVLALATLAAVIFAILNFDQRARFESPDDAVAWRDTDHGVEAWKVSSNGPAARAGIRQGDLLLEIGGQRITRALDVTKRVWRAGLWSQLRYKLSRDGDSFETPVVIAPAEKPVSAENYLRVVGLIYLFIGIFIFVRRWNAPRAVHFYVFCLFSTPSITAESWTRSTTKCIGRASWPGCSLRRYCCILPWFFRNEPRPRANFWQDWPLFMARR